MSSKFVPTPRMEAYFSLAEIAVAMESALSRLPANASPRIMHTDTQAPVSIDIAGIDKGELLAALYNHARPIGLGNLQYQPNKMSIEAGRAHFDAHIEAGASRFDYLQGRCLKVDLRDDVLDARLYERDNGEGIVAQIVANIRSRQNT